jgi:phage FluMu protein Com
LAADRLKFRCYRCNQLLASAPGKAGAVVTCPKCKAELQVPAPEPSVLAEVAPRQADGSGRAAATETPPKSPPLPAYLQEIAAALPGEVADLRPEDLRVEAEFFESLTRTPERPPDQEPVPSLGTDPNASPFPTLDPQSAPAGGLAPPIIGVDTQPRADFTVEPATLQAISRPADLSTPDVHPDAPPIEIEPPTILPPGTEIRTIREVVLPASVVLAWSLFGLIGIATSFIAGLFIGHYFWVVH